MSPIQSRRILRDYAKKLNPLRYDMTKSEYDDCIITLAKIAAVLVAALLVVSVALQVAYS